MAERQTVITDGREAYQMNSNGECSVSKGHAAPVPEHQTVSLGSTIFPMAKHKAQNNTITIWSHTNILNLGSVKDSKLSLVYIDKGTWEVISFTDHCKIL